MSKYTAFRCQECGLRLTDAAALRAVEAGCPRCQGTDIDADLESADLPTPPHPGLTPDGRRAMAADLARQGHEALAMSLLRAGRLAGTEPTSDSLHPEGR